MSEKCNKKKEQVSNLKRSEKEGLKSLRKRVAEGEIVVVRYPQIKVGGSV